jgi:hypothetical protein
MTEDKWPKKVGRGWNTSDGYRFFREQKAEAHQKRVNERRTKKND